MANTMGKVIELDITDLSTWVTELNSAIETEEAGGWVAQKMGLATMTDEEGELDYRAWCLLVHEDYLDAGSSILSTLASVANGEGASLVGVEDAAASFTGTDVEAVLAEIMTLRASVATGEGASMTGIEDADAWFTATDVEAALAELAAGRRVQMIIKPEFTANSAVETAIPIPENLACYLESAYISAGAFPALAGTMLFGIYRCVDDATMHEAEKTYATCVADQNNAIVMQTTDVTKRNLTAGQSAYVKVTSDNAGDSIQDDLRIRG